MVPPKTAQVDALLQRAMTLLKPSATESPQLDAELLLAHLLQQSRTWLHTWPEKQVEPDAAAAFYQLVERRKRGEPIAYLLGSQPFWSLELQVTTDTLIPRPDTELLIEQALATMPEDQPWHVADLGTGSGAIAIAIAHERPRCRVVATDRSRAALAIARENGAQHRLSNIEWREGSWFEPLQGMQFELILSNPPYIAAEDPHLCEGDVRFEPPHALASGPEGLDDLQQIISTAPDHLTPNGTLIVEHGFDQGKEVRSLFQQYHYQNIETRRDLGGQERITYGIHNGT